MFVTAPCPSITWEMLIYSLPLPVTGPETIGPRPDTLRKPHADDLF